MEIEKIKFILKGVDTITFSRHFRDEKSKLRGIEEAGVLINLKSTENLLSAENQGEEVKGHKYALLFRRSNRYDLRVVVSIEGKNLNVITAHIQNIKRRKVAYV